MPCKDRGSCGRKACEVTGCVHAYYMVVTCLMSAPMHSVLTVGVQRACSSVRPWETARNAVWWYLRNSSKALLHHDRWCESHLTWRCHRIREEHFERIQPWRRFTAFAAARSQCAKPTLPQHIRDSPKN
jgi:hypothetical protein